VTDTTPPPAAEALAQRPAPSREASKSREASSDEKAGGDQVSRNKKLAEAWNNCKTQFAEDLAARTSQSNEAIVQATFAACSREEDALRASFAEGRMRPDAVNDTIGRMQQTSRDQIAARVLAIRSEKQAGSVANAKRN